ncbi:replication initiation protein [Romboutsia maritimum]|uniref:Replication initiation protein n=1 Tax=Romboutsia maritimum TaxID=2020948 RepID=A0A371IPK4_9FIRM|nr:replication initiation protein [Romboutsia maritimum]RDY22407.1 replication initiation protein [Romboutsia maritimum]
MNKINLKNINMLRQVLQQYRELTFNSNKFFYYSYGKLDIKIQAILKSSNKTYEDIEDLISIDDLLNISISFDELTILFGCKRIETKTLNNIIKNISNNSSMIINNEFEDETYILFVYKGVTIDRKNKSIHIEFNDDAIRLFENIRTMPFCRIDFEDILNLENKYQMNLYLYALTILRGSEGVITMKIENLRNILGENSVIDDYNFINRFITKPAKEITENNNINLDIHIVRAKSNIKIRVNRLLK